MGKDTEHPEVDGASDRGGALIIRGEAGIGKSALLAAAGQRGRARGMTILSAAGVQAEAHLPFAGLHQLLRPILSRVAHLPAPQRAAVQSAFGLADVPAPDFFLIALAALDLLAEASADTPILLLIDDAQWLDRPTGDVLAFVGRRLAAEPVTLLAAVRDGFACPLDDAGLPDLRPGELDPLPAGALLDTHAPGLDPAVRARLLDEAKGNPLALVELPAALRAEQVSGRVPLPAWLPLTTRLERAFATRSAALPDATRALMLVAATDDDGMLAEVLSAGALVGVPGPTVDLIEPAIEAGLIEIDGPQLHFRHPLIRSAIYQAAPLSRRRAIHAALASALDGIPDRRVWHRAAATAGTDEAVVNELVEMVRRANRRGATSVAILALERAAVLTADQNRRGDLLLDAAELAFSLGRHGQGAQLLREAEPLDLAPAHRVRLAWFQEVLLAENTWSGTAHVRAFVALAEQAHANGNPGLALSRLLRIALRCWWSNPDEETRLLVVDAAERLPVPEDHPLLVNILACAAPAERGAIVAARLARSAPDGTTSPQITLILALAAIAIGQDEWAAPRFAIGVTALRARGQLGELARALVNRAWSALHLGNWHEAVPLAEEATQLARVTTQPLWAAAAQGIAAALAALRGEQESAEVLAAEAEAVFLTTGAHPMLAITQMARGLAALAAERHADAYDHLRRIFDPADIAYHMHVRCWVIADIVESAVHSGQRQEAQALVDELTPLVATMGSPLLRAGLCYARALLADDDAAEALFEATTDPDLAARPFLRARLLLAHGSWLRRQRRTGEARSPLRAARDLFDTLGAVPWAERARRELRAAGEASRDRQPGVLDRLTPQELQIAQLAAEGMSNREIGQQLYLSHRTISTHLYRIFPKLGIATRAELHAAIVGGR